MTRKGIRNDIQPRISVMDTRCAKNMLVEVDRRFGACSSTKQIPTLVASVENDHARQTKTLSILEEG